MGWDTAGGRLTFSSPVKRKEAALLDWAGMWNEGYLNSLHIQALHSLLNCFFLPHQLVDTFPRTCLPLTFFAIQHGIPTLPIRDLVCIGKRSVTDARDLMGDKY